MASRSLPSTPQASQPNRLSFNSPRASPFRRPESPLTRSPSTVRGANGTPASPTKPSSPSSLSPEKFANPFVRRPSQLNSAGAERPKSPFARPTSRLSVTESFADSPSRKPSLSDAPLDAPTRERQPPVTPAEEDPFVANSPSPTVVEPAARNEIHHEPELETPSSPPSLLSPSPIRPAPTSSRPAPHRTVTSSTAATVRPSNTANGASKPAPAPAPTTTRPRTATSVKAPNTSAGGYGHVPAPLLRSMRETFEVLDSANSGAVTAASVASMLDQLGMDASPSSLSAFFPAAAPDPQHPLNLARFLDALAAPLAHLSGGDDLAAAFGAFDVDDSGQIDLGELREGLLHASGTGPEEEALSEREIDAVLGDGKRGEVFRYRDFMAAVQGVGAQEAELAV
ncbi:hypothetical protein H2203_009038 [Taxawa tesnikishii (nom. ined.)]|nr:hypothetical protein H2203_009038 [Dothideales sp. JES 119]